MKVYVAIWLKIIVLKIFRLRKHILKIFLSMFLVFYWILY